jgi:hypothetical protein
MAHMIFIGGFGSHSSQIASVAQSLSDHYNQEVVGVSFSEAQKNLTQVATLARDSIIITHASGMMLLDDMTPQEVIAIAPSLPSTIPITIWRGIKKTASLLKSTSQSNDRSKKVHFYHLRTAKEFITRPQYNIGQVGDMCRFNPAEAAVKMINRGAKVTLGFMDHDLLYPQSARHVHVDMARRHGAEIHEDIKGHHDEFLLYPLKILEQLNRF